MRARDANSFFVAIRVSNEHFAVLDDRQFHLTDLIALRQIRIKVVLASKHRTTRNGRVDGEPKHRGHSHHLFVQDWQNTRVAKVNQASLRIWFGSISR